MMVFFINCSEDYALHLFFPSCLVGPKSFRGAKKWCPLFGTIQGKGRGT